ncbi:histidine biosynthesis protein [Flavobacteria bacterium MS024-3C]|jgi:imidazole glycerol-phosphate synthase subunit HisF|nr:histidine biosynthesis protein [Flavobacteria bacterium MS024-3C]
MLKNRIIPILTFNGLGLVKTKGFKNPRMVGNPVQTARVFNSRGVDELIFLDIYATKQSRKINLSLVKEVIKECYMPVSIGGGIQTIDQINDLLKIGADKVVIKSKALTDKKFLKEAINFFGSQCICISVDVLFVNNNYLIYNDLGLKISLEEFITEMSLINAGELLVNSVNNDGVMNGFDIDLINKVEQMTTIPVIAAGGGGEPEHYSTLFNKTKINAVASSSIFHFTQYTPLDIKNELKKFNFPVRT